MRERARDTARQGKIKARAKHKTGSQCYQGRHLVTSPFSLVRACSSPPVRTAICG
jgi:hypothetical protein